MTPFIPTCKWKGTINPRTTSTGMAMEEGRMKATGSKPARAIFVLWKSLREDFDASAVGKKEKTFQ
jgi:hypothetical protein